mgnify:CR=1 FL=1
MKYYHTINEVSALLGVNASHLRFLEKEFPQLKPVTNSRGVRRYTEADIDLLRSILHLTKECGYTIEGARQQLKASQRAQAQGQTSPLEARMALVEQLKTISAFLDELKGLL